jgi:hypothetical protein
MIKTSVTYRGHPSALKKTLRKAVKEAVEKAVFSWHARYAKHHFRQGATARYGYAARTAKYKRRKRHQHGHAQPLVYSGAAKRQILRQVRVSSSAASKTPKTAKGSFTAPRYFWIRKPKHPDKGQELVGVVQREADKLAQLVDRHVERRVNACNTRRHRRLS